MIEVQFDLFKTREECEFEALAKAIDKVRVSSDKVRRGCFAKLNEVQKENTELKARLDIIERNICKGATHGP